MKITDDQKIAGAVILLILLFAHFAFNPLAVIGNKETVRPEAYNYWGVVTNYQLMDGSTGHGEFEAGKAGWVKFRNTNDPFTKANYADGYISFKLHYMDVSNNGNDARLILNVYSDSDTSTPAATYHIFCEDYDGWSHWTTQTTTDKLSKFDTNGDGIINYAVLMHRDDFNDWVRVYELQYVITFDEPAPDPCLGVTCLNKCIGEYWSTEGECYNGDCKYTKEKIDGKCGYVIPTPTATPTSTPTPTATLTPTPTPTATEPNGDDPEPNDDILIIGGFMVGIIAVLALLYFAIKARK